MFCCRRTMFTPTTERSRSCLLQSNSNVNIRPTSSNLPHHLEAHRDVPPERAKWASHLLDQLNQLRNHGQYCDTFLRSCDENVFPAHFLVLAAVSDKLHTSFPGKGKHKYSIHLSADNSTVKCFLDFLYTGRISCSAA